MYTKQISILHNNFLGVYSADHLPSKWLVGQLLIVNCCPSHKHGIHWIDISIQQVPVQTVTKNYDFQVPVRPFTLASKNSRSFFRNVWSHHCIFYVHCNARKRSLQAMRTFFTKSFAENDQNVCFFLRPSFINIRFD